MIYIMAGIFLVIAVSVSYFRTTKNSREMWSSNYDKEEGGK